MVMNKTKRPFVWAHRGASAYCPENTLPAFAKAMEMGADGIELDVQMTKDGELVVCHDEKIDRTSDGKGWLKDFTLAELRNFDFSYGYEAYKGVKVPTLREVFELFADTNMTINIELKTGIMFYNGIEEKTIALTEEYGFMERVIFSSFNHLSVKRVKELRPVAKCAFLYADGTIGMPEYAKLHGMSALHPALYNLQYEGFMQECKEKNIDVNVWTVDDEEYIKMCYMLGVDAIITNCPDKVFAVIESMSGSDNE